MEMTIDRPLNLQPSIIDPGLKLDWLNGRAWWVRRGHEFDEPMAQFVYRLRAQAARDGRQLMLQETCPHVALIFQFV